jgi:magnesium chelatase subunit I
MTARPHTLGELKTSGYRRRSVKDELRENLIVRLRSGEPLFPGIVGYDESVVPALVNALLARHNFILLGLRGQAKTRILRQLAELLDPEIPVLAGSEVNDDPLNPISKYGRRLVEEQGDETPIEWREREFRYVEKLATPDVTVADLIGDMDPIRAARGGHLLSDELTIHFGLLPRANRGIFAINELPDLSGKVQVALFNVMQEGDIQIKGYPVRLPLDVMLVFSANPEDYTARGKIITPLKDRIGAEILTHYPKTPDEGMEITRQEAWVQRNGREVLLPEFIAEVIERIAFLAREDKRIDRRSGVSQRLPISALEIAISNAERRSLVTGDDQVVARVADIYAALPAITGKIELEYEGEMQGAEAVARDLVAAAAREVFDRYWDVDDLESVISYFETGGVLQISDTASADPCW